MSGCNCDGTITQSFSDYWNSLANWSDVFGGVAPDEQARIACQNAVDQMNARQIDPCVYPDELNTAFAFALKDVQGIVESEPYQNALQRAVDVAAGQSSAPLVNRPPAPATNWTFIIGAIALLVVGFILIFK